MTVLEELQRSAEGLSAVERDQLISSLIANRERDQNNTIARRIAEIDSGSVKGDPSEHVISEARKRLDGLS